ncbi:MAG: DMT family transporter [Salaquimonas sp.]|jgi:drug/metabolite transporter (DMT)-like permease|nr:DMT family transporter [Salaquimonas sp.]
MGQLIVELAGTPAGHLLALALALLSALAHAIFGAINKGGVDPFVNRGAINLCYGLMAMPIAFFVVPWPSQELFMFIGAVLIVHVVYETLQSASFHLGAFTVVYPIARGTGPFFTALAAVFIFSEHLAPGQWIGLVILSTAIISLAIANIMALRREAVSSSNLQIAITVALATGAMIAVYTTADAYGIRLADDPFTFLAWFFFVDGFAFPVIAYWRWRRIKRKPPLDELALRGLFGAVIGMMSFGALMLATRLGKVGEAAALRETSIIFATGIGVLIFREKIDLPRIVIIGFIAAGAIMVELH